MTLNFYATDAWLFSPTYYEHFEKQGILVKENDWADLPMHLDINIQDSTDDDEIPKILFSMENKMWEDPIKEDNGRLSYGISFFFEMNLIQLRYLNKYIETFIKEKEQKQNQ